LSNVADFNHFKFRRVLWHQKTRVSELLCDIACMILCSAVLTQYRHVTEEWMDRQTDGPVMRQLIPHLSYSRDILGGLKI